VDTLGIWASSRASWLELAETPLVSDRASETGGESSAAIDATLSFSKVFLRIIRTEKTGKRRW
jgi:hypothetical protein